MKEEKISQHQLFAVTAVSLMSQVMRVLPISSASLAGKAAWLSAIIAAVPCVVYSVSLCRFMKSRGEGEGLAELLRRILGKYIGGAVLLLAGAWVLFYAGYILRASAERLMSTVYGGSSPIGFMAAALIASFLAARGGLRATARTAEIFLPLLIIAGAGVTFFALGGVSKYNLLPVTAHDAAPAALGALPILNVFSSSMWFAFLAGSVPKSERGTERRAARWSAWAAAGILLLTVAVIGTLSAERTVRVQNAFFVMLRSVRLFGVVERFEAVAVAMWVITDFIYLASLLKIAEAALCGALMKKPIGSVLPLAAAAIMALSLVPSPDAFYLRHLSYGLVPVVNFFVTVPGLFTIYIIGRLRRKLGRNTRCGMEKAASGQDVPGTENGKK